MKNIFIHLGFILILVGCSIIFVDKASASINSYYEDVNKSNKIISLVHNNYSEFKDNSLNIKNSIVDVSNTFDFYLDDFENANIEITNKIKKVENEINSLYPTIENLITYCVYDLNDAVMNNECDSFKINFNNMLSSYNKMISVYNDVIKEYNDYSDLNGKEHVLEYSQNLDNSIVVASSIIK